MFQKIAWFVLVFFTVDGIYNLAGAPTGSFPPGATTPKNLFITLNSVEISSDARRPYKTIFGCPPSDSSCVANPTTIDVVGQTGLPGSVFGPGTPLLGEYKAVRLTFNAKGSYTGTNPCTGDDVTNADIELPESENGQDVVINYMVPHPVLGLQSGFRLMQSMKVGSTPIDLHLVFTASHSVVCTSSEKPRAISGDSTQMAKPLGVALDDTMNDEIALVNGAPTHNRVTFYSRTVGGNQQPLRSIEGVDTELDTPIGIYLDTYNHEIGVTNNGNNSLTVYDRTALTDTVNDTHPLYTLMGNNTGLSSPGLAAFYSDQSDHNNDEILVTNGGNNSVTIYNRKTVHDMADPTTRIANVSPLQTIGRDFVVTDIIPDANNVINLTESGGAGNCTPNCNVAILANSYKTGTDLAAAVQTALNNNNVLTPGTSFNVAYDDINRRFTITVTNLGASSVTFNWDDTTNSTAAKVLGFHPVSSGPLVSNSSIISDFGDLTGLNIPCGIYVDPVNNEIGVANNGNGSITIFDWSDKGNATPKRTISGPRTDLSGPCGISLHPDPSDPTKGEIVVANTGDDSVRIYSRMANGNVPPLRSIKGNPTGLSQPVGIALHLDPSDHTNDEIVAANSGHDSLTIHKQYYDKVQLKSLPVMFPSGQQQALSSQYSFSYSGTIDTIDTPPQKTPSTPAGLNGYSFVWKITDDRIRQKTDASSAYLFPPGNTVFQLADGEIVPYLPMDCTVINPFITLTLSTNCPPSPLIHSPLPIVGGEYRIASVLFSQVTFTKFPLNSNPLEESEFPRLRPKVKVTNNNIDEIGWDYTDAAGVVMDGITLPSPLIFSQEFQINLTEPFGNVLTCYKPVQGNDPNLVFDSGPLLPSDRFLKSIKNNKCPIFFNTVDNIIFTVTDALSNSYIFTWKII